MRPAKTVTPAMVDERIAETHFTRVGLMTICVITMDNGFQVTGESACVHPDMYDEQIGTDLALERAKQKIWMLEGYILKDAHYRWNETYG